MGTKKKGRKWTGKTRKRRLGDPFHMGGDDLARSLVLAEVLRPPRRRRVTSPALTGN